MASNKICDDSVFDLECPLCSEKYGPEKNIPKTLQCGHKICIDCHNGLFQFVQLCPTCKVTIEPTSEVTTNPNSFSIGSYSDASSQSKMEMLSDQISTGSSSVSKCGMLSIEIPRKTSFESIMKKLSSEIHITDTSSKYIKEIVNNEISKDKSVRPKQKRLNMENPRDTPSEIKVEMPNIDIPTATSTDTSLESKWKMLSTHIDSNMLSEPKNEMPSIEIPTNTSLESKWKMLSAHIDSNTLPGSKNEMPSIEVPTDTSLERKWEMLSTHIDSNTLPGSKNEIPQKSCETRTQPINTSIDALKLGAFEILQELTDSSEKLKNSNDTKEKTGKIFNSQLELYTTCISYIQELENLRNLYFMISSCYNTEIKAYFTLNNFSSREEYINEIIFELLKGKDMYAVNLEWHDTALYWGSMTYNDGKLYIHSFSNEIPEYPPQFVLFSDLKKCMTINNFRTFIDIEEYHLVCTIFTSSQQTWSFINLCSGESGESYRGLNAKVTLLENGFSGVVVLGKDLADIAEDRYEFLHSPTSRLNEIHGDKLVVVRGGRCEILFASSIPDTELESFDEVIASVSSFNKEFSYTSLGPVTSIKNCGLIILPLGQ